MSAIDCDGADDQFAQITLFFFVLNEMSFLMLPSRSFVHVVSHFAPRRYPSIFPLGFCPRRPVKPGRPIATEPRVVFVLSYHPRRPLPAGHGGKASFQGFSMLLAVFFSSLNMTSVRNQPLGVFFLLPVGFLGRRSGILKQKGACP